jgi:hypothetical protein
MFGQVNRQQRRSPAANSIYKKLAVQWLNEALYFYQSLSLVDIEVLRNRHLRVAAKRELQGYSRNRRIEESNHNNL